MSDESHRVIAVIPARYSSTRFPGKPLALIDGVPMITRVISQVQAARRIDAVWVATDDARIGDVARAAGARVALTANSHRSGTDRIHEAMKSFDAAIVLNVQGDEPLVSAISLDRLVVALQKDGTLAAATLAYPLRRREEWLSPDTVKVVIGTDGTALYFSRAPIPHPRESPGRVPRCAWKHLGVYAYRRATLESFARLDPTPLETLESLEQLRLLERGFKMAVVRAVTDSISVDRPEDVAKVESHLRRSAAPVARRSAEHSL